MHQVLLDIIIRQVQDMIVQARDLGNPHVVMTLELACHTLQRQFKGFQRTDVAVAQAGRDALAGGLSPEFVAEELRAALNSVGEIVGRADVEDILGRIFSTFCIGK